MGGRKEERKEKKERKEVKKNQYIRNEEKISGRKAELTQILLVKANYY